MRIFFPNSLLAISVLTFVAEAKVFDESCFMIGQKFGSRNSNIIDTEV